jgi:hypothetical protein
MAGQLRTRGPFAFVVEAQSNWSRLRAVLVTAVWQQRQQIRIIETSSDHKWHVTYGIRFGFDWKLP